MTRQITFNNLITLGELSYQLIDAFHRVRRSGIFLNGLECEAFSHQWAEYCGKKYCILTASGLDALKLVLRAWEIKASDVVYVPAWTCTQTWLAVEHIGAIPTPFHYSHHIKAAVQVHLYGALTQIDLGRDMRILDDACQAHGLEGIGDPACYSFYPTKNLGTLGDGGAIVTDDKRLFNRLNKMINHSAKRLDEVQCAFLRAKLPYLDRWNETRRINAGRYLDGLEGVGLPDNLNSVWHQFVIRVKDRDKLIDHLILRDIQTMIHYPYAPYTHLGYYYNLPEIDRRAKEVLSLPVGPHLSLDDIDYVIEAVNDFTTY